MYENDEVQILQALDPDSGLSCVPEPIHSATTRHLAPSQINWFSQMSF